MLTSRKIYVFSRNLYVHVELYGTECSTSRERNYVRSRQGTNFVKLCTDEVDNTRMSSADGRNGRTYAEADDFPPPGEVTEDDAYEQKTRFRK